MPTYRLGNEYSDKKKPGAKKANIKPILKMQPPKTANPPRRLGGGSALQQAQTAAQDLAQPGAPQSPTTPVYRLGNSYSQFNAPGAQQPGLANPGLQTPGNADTGTSANGSQFSLANPFGIQAGGAGNTASGPVSLAHPGQNQNPSRPIFQNGNSFSDQATPGAVRLGVNATQGYAVGGNFAALRQQPSGTAPSLASLAQGGQPYAEGIAPASPQQLTTQIEALTQQLAALPPQTQPNEPTNSLAALAEQNGSSPRGQRLGPQETNIEQRLGIQERPGIEQRSNIRPLATAGGAPQTADDMRLKLQSLGAESVPEAPPSSLADNRLDTPPSLSPADIPQTQAEADAIARENNHQPVSLASIPDLAPDRLGPPIAELPANRLAQLPQQREEDNNAVTGDSIPRQSLAQPFERTVKDDQTTYTTPQGSATFQGEPGQVARRLGVPQGSGSVSVIEGRTQEDQNRINNRVASINNTTDQLRLTRLARIEARDGGLPPQLQQERAQLEGKTQGYNQQVQGQIQQGIENQLAGQELAIEQQPTSSFGQPQEVIGPDGQPQLVQFDKAGNVRPVEGYQPQPPASNKQYRALTSRQQDKLLDAGNQLADTTRIVNSFDPSFAGNATEFTGDLENNLMRRGLVSDPKGRAQFWQDYQNFKNITRHEFFGSALTATEKTEFEKAVVNPSMDPPQIEKNLARQREILLNATRRRAKTMLANGSNPEAIRAAFGDLAPEIFGDQQQGQPEINEAISQGLANGQTIEDIYEQLYQAGV